MWLSARRVKSHSSPKARAGVKGGAAVAPPVGGKYCACPQQSGHRLPDWSHSSFPSARREMRLAVRSSLVPMAGGLPRPDLGVVASTSNPKVFHPGDPTSAQIPCVLVHTEAGSAGSTATAE